MAEEKLRQQGETVKKIVTQALTFIADMEKDAGLNLLTSAGASLLAAVYAKKPKKKRHKWLRSVAAEIPEIALEVLFNNPKK